MCLYIFPCDTLLPKTGIFTYYTSYTSKRNIFLLSLWRLTYCCENVTFKSNINRISWKNCNWEKM